MQPQRRGPALAFLIGRELIGDGIRASGGHGFHGRGLIGNRASPPPGREVLPGVDRWDTKNMLDVSRRIGRNSKVSFLIAGVQKGATSALHLYLRQHPWIYMPERKEFHFFDDEELNWRRPSYESYDAEFGDAKPFQLTGEATPVYTYWRPAVDRIHSYNPRIKLIVSLRDPVARAYSHWRMETVRSWDTLDFSRAIREGRDRVVTQGQIEGQHRVFSYVERGFYAVQVERLFARFPRDRIFFLTRMDLLRRRESTLDSICKFLDIPKWRKYPPHEIVRSRASAGVDPPSVKDIRYLRELFREDLEITESLIGRTIELEYP